MVHRLEVFYDEIKFHLKAVDSKNGNAYRSELAPIDVPFGTIYCFVLEVKTKISQGGDLKCAYDIEAGMLTPDILYVCVCV